MFIANQLSRIAVSNEYIVYPTQQQQVQNKIGVLHHFVDLSKKWYFMSAWKNFKLKKYTF